jgi:hypothetical protein
MTSHAYAITGMNPNASFVVHTLRFAGLFNLPIPLRCASVIGVSQINIASIGIHANKSGRALHKAK